MFLAKSEQGISDMSVLWLGMGAGRRDVPPGLA